MKKLMLWRYEHPVHVIVLLLGATIFFACYIPAILSEEMRLMRWSRDDPVKALYDDTLETFGSCKITVVFVKNSRLFTPEVLARLKEFQSVLEKIPGVYRVDSLFSIPNLKGEEGVLYVNPFVNEVPETLEEAQAIKADALRNSLVLDNLVSRDGSAIAFNLFIDENIGQNEKSFSIQVDEAISTIAPYMEKVFQLGEPYIKRVLYEGHVRDQRRLIPPFRS